jgi:outer membrane protein OmpU
MKKVLFATTALVATAGMAAADVNLSGSGRFGIVYNSQDVNGVDSGLSKTKIESRLTIHIDGSGSTDGGLDFGGRIRLRSDEGDAASSAASSNVWMGNDSFRITVGNADGALLNRVGYYQGSVGLTGLHWANVSFNIGTSRFDINSFSSRGNTGDVVRLDFNVGGFGVSVSTDTTGAHNPSGTTTEDAIAVSYNFGDWTVAAGFASDASASIIAVGGVAAGTAGNAISASIVGSIGDFGVGLGYTDKENIGAKVTLSGSYSFGDTNVAAFVANTSEDIAGSAGISATAGSDTEYGIGFTHSLGGATLAGGISRNFQKNTMADLGIRFNF